MGAHQRMFDGWMLCNRRRQSLGTTNPNFGALGRSQTMSKSQNTAFALAGARVSAQYKPPEGDAGV